MTVDPATPRFATTGVRSGIVGLHSWPTSDESGADQFEDLEDVDDRRGVYVFPTDAVFSPIPRDNVLRVDTDFDIRARGVDSVRTMPTLKPYVDYSNGITSLGSGYSGELTANQYRMPRYNTAADSLSTARNAISIDAVSELIKARDRASNAVVASVLGQFEAKINDIVSEASAEIGNS